MNYNEKFSILLLHFKISAWFLEEKKNVKTARKILKKERS